MAGRLALTWCARRRKGAVGELASLREDYLSQVQRDFLSHRPSAGTPLAKRSFERTRIVIQRLIENRRFHAQQLVQSRAGCRVLQLDRLVGKNQGCRRERCKGGLMKARQDQLLLARIGVDVADGE